MDKVLFNDIYQIFMSFCMLCMVAFCQSVLLKRDDDDDDDDQQWAKSLSRDLHLS